VRARLSHAPMIASAAGLVCRRIARRCVGVFLQGGACPGLRVGGLLAVASEFSYKVVRVPVCAIRADGRGGLRHARAGRRA